MTKLKSNKTNKSNKNKDNRDYFVQQLVEENYRNRFWITLVTIITFLVLLVSVLYSMYNNVPISKDWKDVLMLMLGAFIGSFQKIVHFWFETRELIKEMLQIASKEDDDQRASQNNIKSSTDNDKKQLLKD